MQRLVNFCSRECETGSPVIKIFTARDAQKGRRESERVSACACVCVRVRVRMYVRVFVSGRNLVSELTSKPNFEMSLLRYPNESQIELKSESKT